VAKESTTVVGIGINDVERVNLDDGSICPIYVIWRSMLVRCETLERYANTSVCEEWLLFSNFKGWVDKREYKDLHLDKDLIGKGDLYSPNTCCFLPVEINSFLVKCNSADKLSIGTNWHIRQGKWTGKIADPFTKRRVWLGTFESKGSAHEAWRSKKHEYAKALARSFPISENAEKALICKYSYKVWYSFDNKNTIEEKV
jgi:hypothetical protein